MVSEVVDKINSRTLVRDVAIRILHYRHSRWILIHNDFLKPSYTEYIEFYYLYKEYLIRIHFKIDSVHVASLIDFYPVDNR